jgi:hypothetical protein
VISTGQRNTLFLEERRSVSHETKNTHLLHRNPKGTDVGPLGTGRIP